jgi:hypothetical protein
MKSKVLKFRIPVLVLGVFLVGAALSANTSGRTSVYVNDHELTSQELTVTQQQLGARVPPGNYVYDDQSGCWMEMNTGRSGCPGYAGGGNLGSESYVSRYGSGESNGTGEWNN